MAQEPIKVLIVTYVFPPFAAVGVYRILKFCKYFREFGIDPIILTPNNPNVLARDEGLLESIPADTIVYRTLSAEPFRVRQSGNSSKTEIVSARAKNPEDAVRPRMLTHIKQAIRAELSIPDSSYLWSWVGLTAGIRAVYKQNVDLVLSSSPPQSVHLLASRISRFTGRPHVVDFRDLWTQNTSYSERKLPVRLARRDRQMEEAVLRSISGVLVNTASFREQLIEKNSFLDPSMIKVVTNGVDRDDFLPYVGERSQNRKFTILYSGSLYGTHRNPEFFFLAVKRLVDGRPEIGKLIRLLFIGNWTEQHRELVDSCGVSSFVDILGWLPQRKVLDEIFSADLLLLIQGFDSALSAAIPRKLYEYIISGRPIMGFAPEGEIPRLIYQYDSGVCFQDDSPEPIIEHLAQEFDNWECQRHNEQKRLAQLRPMPELETRAQVQKAAKLIRTILSDRD